MFNVYLLVLDTIGCQEKYDLSRESSLCIDGHQHSAPPGVIVVCLHFLSGHRINLLLGFLE